MNRREFLKHAASLPVLGSSIASATGRNHLRRLDDRPGPFTNLQTLNFETATAGPKPNAESLLRRIAVEVASRTGQPEAAPNWTARSINLHRMGSKWWCDGLAVVANLQPMRRSADSGPASQQTCRSKTTWWMVQIPNGIGDDASHHLAHVVLVPYFSEGRTPKREQHCWHLIDGILRHIHRGDENGGRGFWKTVARMNAPEAGRTLNRAAHAGLS